MAEKPNINALMKEHLGEFRPVAYFDKHLDCIRVKVSDCRCVEVRLNRFLTVLEKRSALGRTCVGFTIKGVAYLFQELGMPREGIYKVIDILNKILERYPDQAVRLVHDEFANRDTVSSIEVDTRVAV
jgi:hypothetical protein